MEVQILSTALFCENGLKNCVNRIRGDSKRAIMVVNITKFNAWVCG